MIHTSSRYITDVKGLVRQRPALGIFVIVSPPTGLLSQHATGIFPTYFFLSRCMQQIYFEQTSVFKFLNRVSILCGIPPIPTLSASSRHARKEKNSPLPYPHFYHPHPLIEFAGTEIAQISDIHFSLLIPRPFAHIPRHPITSGPRPTDFYFLLSLRCIRSKRPLHNILVVRSGPASHYGSDLIRTYYRQGENIFSAFCRPLCSYRCGFLFSRHAPLHLAASLLLSPVATSDDSQLGAGQIR